MKKLGQQGSAIVIAIVAGMLVMVLSLSMLLVSYSLFQNTVQNSDSFAEKELAYSCQQALEKQFLAEYLTRSELEGSMSHVKNELYFYLTQKLDLGDWKTCNEVFKLTGTEEAGYYTKVNLYWKTNDDNDYLLCLDIDVSNDQEVLYRLKGRYRQKYENGIWSFEKNE